MQTGPAIAVRPANRYLGLKWLAPAIVFAIVGLARLVYVSLYGAALPFWDQWDELDRQIRPWFNGTWHFLQLFVPHGEHRIVFTRGISFLLASANNHVFDNLVETYANILIYACLWAVVYALLVRGNISKTRAWLIAVAVIVLGALPFDWENTLVGFQNQFYLMELFAVVAVGIAAYRAPSLGTFIALAILALASVFTMGSGLLAAPAVCLAVFIRTWREPIHRKHTIFVLVAMLLVTAFGLALLLHSRKQAALQAHSPAQMITALLVCLMWPLQYRLQVSHWLFAGMLWLPSIIWIVSYFKNHRAHPDEVFAIALTAWVMLQCLAIAGARGHDMQFLPSRYSEIPAIGIAANVWLAIKRVSLNKERKRLVFGIMLGCGTALLGWVFWQRTPGDLQAMQQRHDFTTVETSKIRAYLVGQPLPVLPEGSLILPYPSAARLRDLLGNAEIRPLLLPAYFPPSDPHRTAPLSSLAAALQRSVRRLFPTNVWMVNAKALAAITPSTFIYAHAVPEGATDTQCSLDVIGDQPAANAKPVAPGAVVVFVGWAGDGHGKPIGKGLFILKSAQHTYAAPFTTGVNRPDVAEVLDSSAMVNSGFSLTAMFDSVPAGTYSLFIATPESPATICALRQILTVK